MAKGGRPEHVPTAITRDRVQWLAAFGVDQDKTAETLGITKKTLAKHYRAELNRGQTGLVELAGKTIVRALNAKKISQHTILSAMFVLKAKGAWRDNHQRVEHANPDGSNVAGSVTNNTVLYLPDNGRDPDLYPLPMKTIEGKKITRKAKALPAP